MKLIVLGILFSIFVAFVLRAAAVAILVVSGTFLSISATFALRAAVVTKPVMVVVLFSISVVFMFRSVFLTSPLVLAIFLSTSLIIFPRFYLSELYCVLETNPLVLDIVIALTFVTNSSNTFFWQFHYLVCYLAYLSQLPKSVFYLSTSALYTSTFRLATSDFFARLNIYTQSLLLNQLLLHNQIDLIWLFHLF